MRKMISFILTLCLLGSTCIGCGGTTKEQESPPAADQGTVTESPAVTETAEPELEPYKIAVAFTQINASALTEKKYLETYVGPAFNVEFMFSEAIEDVDALMTFMENAYAAGCHAIMNFQNTSIEQANAKANELGMYIISNCPPGGNSELPYCLGYMRPSVSNIADMFKSVTKDFVSDGKDHNVIIVSAGAGLGNEQHYESTVGILEALQEIYGLTYDDEIGNIAAARSQTEVNTGKDMKILIYPGFPGTDTFVSGMSSVLQTGDYDIVLACNQAYTQFTVAIDEVEKAYGFNIKTAAILSIDDTTNSLFNTTDSTGDTSLNSVMVLPCTTLVGGMFAVLYNGLTGYADAVKQDGAGFEYSNPFWMAKNADEYAALQKIDSSADTYELSIDELKDMIVIFNPEASRDSISTKLASITPESVIEARGIK